MIQGIVWSAEMINALTDLCDSEDNLTYVVIAERMSKRFQMEFTKNACIGKARRLAQPPRPAKKTKDGRASRATLVPIDAPIQPKLRWRTGAAGISIYHLSHNRCHWPLAEFEERPPYFYCGKPTLEGASWCENHCKRVYHNGLR